MLDTKNTDSNYLCKVVELKDVRKHSNADRLQVVDIGMNTVITGLDAKDGDIYVFFPLESKISEDFLSFTNSFRDNTKNVDPSAVGFFEDNCRVRAMSLRGERSMGYIVPARIVEQWGNSEGYIGDYLEWDFDTIGGKLLVTKYETKKKVQDIASGKKPQLTRLVDGQINLHVKTKNLRHTPEAIKPNDVVSITYKTHGTSWWAGNVLVKRQLNTLERVLRYLGVGISDKVYDVVYGSRNVVKNKSFKDPKQSNHFYGVNIWSEINEEIGHLIPKGFTLYGECLGFTSTGEFIQKGFDYGCDPKGENGKPQRKLEVYRITQTNSDGLVTELSAPEILEFCDERGLSTPHLYFIGRAKDWYNTDYSMSLASWSKGFVEAIQKTFNDKDCFMCDESVPEEGVVIRKEKLIGCESYKVKSFRFLEWETKALDKGEVDVESEN